MVYRIRYRTGETGEAEVAVEANSPTEALVKFRYAYGAVSPCGNMPDSVTSVSPEEVPPIHP